MVMEESHSRCYRRSLDRRAMREEVWHCRWCGWHVDLPNWERGEVVNWNDVALRILGFWGPKPLLYRFKPLHWRVQWFLGWRISYHCCEDHGSLISPVEWYHWSMDESKSSYFKLHQANKGKHSTKFGWHLLLTCWKYSFQQQFCSNTCHHSIHSKETCRNKSIKPTKTHKKLHLCNLPKLTISSGSKDTTWKVDGATPISLGLSWPLTNRHLLWLAKCHLHSRQCTLPSTPFHPSSFISFIHPLPGEPEAFEDEFLPLARLSEARRWPKVVFWSLGKGWFRVESLDFFVWNTGNGGVSEWWFPQS